MLQIQFKQARKQAHKRFMSKTEAFENEKKVARMAASASGPQRISEDLKDLDV